MTSVQPNMAFTVAVKVAVQDFDGNRQRRRVPSSQEQKERASQGPWGETTIWRGAPACGVFLQPPGSPGALPHLPLTWGP